MAPRIAKSLDVLRSQVNLAFPGRDKSSDGWIGDAAHAATKSEHNPDANGVVRALDITNDPAHGVDARRLVQALLDSRDARILYVISNGQMARSYVKAGTTPWQWAPYTGANAHRAHCHISVVDDPTLYDATRPWAIKGGPAIPPPPPPPMPGTKRFTGITATVFGGLVDPNNSAYDGHPISDMEMGVALPFRFKGTKPLVKVWKDGKVAICMIVDVGPWNINDPYWEFGRRPQAETGTDVTGRKTNRAGIDLTPAAARAIGLNGMGLVDWEFVGGVPISPPTIPPPILPTSPVAERTWLQKMLDAIKAFLTRS